MRLPLLSLALLACSAAAGSGCAQTSHGRGAQAYSGAQWTAQAEEGSLEERARRVFADSALPARNLDEEVLYKFLLAEIAAQRGNMQVAAQAYLDLAKTTRDPRVARRATEVALSGKLNDVALQAARIWLNVEKNSAAARQTIATLLINARDLQAAKPLLAEVLASEKKNVGASLMQLQGVLGRHPDKAAVYELVRELVQPYARQPEAQLVLAQAAQAANRNEAALAASREALRLRPDWEQAALLHAQILARESRGQSLDFLKEFLVLNAQAQEVRLNYARGLIAEKRYPEARAQFQTLLAAHADNADLAFTVALLSMQMSDYEAADLQLRRVLELGYKDPDTVRFQLGQVNEELKRKEEAGRWYRTVEGGDQYAAAHARYALLLARDQKVAEAREYLRALKPQNETQRIQIVQAEAHVLREVRQYQASYDVLRQALEQQPDHLDLLYDIALAAEKLDRLDVVESSLRRLIALKPDHAQAWNALGYTLADRTDRLTEAREYIEKALQLAPDDPFILDSLGWVHYRLGNHQQGIEYLRRAFEQRRDPEIAAHLGEVLWVQGRREEAERIWREALSEHPDSEELHKVMRRFKQ
ncbi:MAG TPA: tetratricopeptide repeat protein [Burkholderiales bacterium]|jgi:tetratricopeptide (TPR) repeat protein|nr:tetratricopeptide repeat protein [Burkholderiales bacterium]